ncbi:MAG: hypothetical protein J6W06_06525 [Bacteroidales bacterium]|nr:hypothetical protein [Bacteroidales bacterium]
MKRIIILAIISIFASGIAKAQEQTIEPTKNDRESVRTTMSLSGGMQYIDTKGINNDLANAGYGYFSNINYLLGIGVDVTIYDRWIIGAEWDKNNNTTSTINPNLSMKAEMSGSRTMIRFGYNVVHNNFFNLFPEIGFGGNLIKFSTKSLTPDSIATNFPQILQSNDGNMVNYTNSFANIGLGIDFTISDSGNAQSGCRVGIRAGYQIAFSHSWSNNSTNIDGPKISPNMFYIKLTVGFTTKYNHKNDNPNTADTL